MTSEILQGLSVIRVVALDNEAIKRLQRLRLFCLLLQLVVKVGRASPPAGGRRNEAAGSRAETTNVIISKMQRASQRIRTFTLHHPFVGPVFWMLSIQYFLIQLFVADAWPV
ncbi:MAG: hypothetical protein ACRD4B_05350, partial [Acidobacteriota bacterium]